MDKILIIGADGQLGRELSKLFPDSYKLYHSGHGENNIDLSETNKLIQKLKAITPDIVINASSLTNVDKCEEFKDYAYKINGYSLKYITEYCRSNDIKLIHISTDYVFDGNSSLYKEDSIPDPINYYGFSKLIGDIYADSYEKSLVIRTSGVYGFKNNYPLFVYNSLKNNNYIKAIPGYYSPIHAYNLALSIKKLMDLKIYGVINIAGIRVSRLELAYKIAEYFNLDKKLISEVKTNLKAKRPFDSSLNIEKAKSLIDFDFYSLNSNLKAFENNI
jgi:dTDP-4-dehydrorhamnose reductase